MLQCMLCEYCIHKDVWCDLPILYCIVYMAFMCSGYVRRVKQLDMNVYFLSGQCVLVYIQMYICLVNVGLNFLLAGGDM